MSVQKGIGRLSKYFTCTKLNAPAWWCHVTINHQNQKIAGD